MLLNQKYRILSGAFFLLLSTCLHSQNRYDNGREDAIYSQIIVDSVSQKFHLYYQSWDMRYYFITDSNTTYHKLILNKDLTIDSNVSINIPYKQANSSVKLSGNDENVNILTHTINNLSVTGSLPSFDVYLSKSYLCKETPDGINSCTLLTPDSAYGVNVFTESSYSEGDTLYFLARWADSMADSTWDIYFFRYNVITDNFKWTLIPELTDSNGVYQLTGDFIRLNDGTWFFPGVYITHNQNISAKGIQLNASLNSLIRSIPLSTPNTNSYRRKTWYINNKIIFYGPVWDYSPQTQKISYDVGFEVIDLSKSTNPVERYFFDSSPLSGKNYDQFAGNAALFMGQYFIFSSVSDTVSEVGQEPYYEANIMVVDTNFNLVNHHRIKNENSKYFSVGISSLILHPWKANTLVYSGGIYSPVLYNDSFDIMWGELPIVGHVSTKEKITLNKHLLSVFPNPAGEFINLINNMADFKPYKVDLYNYKGQFLNSSIINKSHYQLPLHLGAGSYFMVAIINDHQP